MEIFSIGFLAGLALAIPLGPMAVLLISTTISRGRKIAIFGALAMSSVDFLYALLVYSVGDLVLGALADWVLPLRIVGSLLLVATSVKIFISARKISKTTLGSEETKQLGRVGTYVTFFGLTVINPATAFYFVGVTPSVSALSAGSNLAFAAFVFAGGVFLASIIWQSMLVVGANLVRKASSSGIQAKLQYLGAALIFALAIGLLLKQ